MRKVNLLGVTVIGRFLPFCRPLFQELHQALKERIKESPDKFPPQWLTHRKINHCKIYPDHFHLGNKRLHLQVAPPEGTSGIPLQLGEWDSVQTTTPTSSKWRRNLITGRAFRSQTVQWILKEGNRRVGKSSSPKVGAEILLNAQYCALQRVRLTQNIRECYPYLHTLPAC